MVKVIHYIIPYIPLVQNDYWYLNPSRAEQRVKLYHQSYIKTSYILVYIKCQVYFYAHSTSTIMTSSRNCTCFLSAYHLYFVHVC